MRHCALESGLPAGTHQDVLVRLPVPGNTEMTAAVRRYVTPATGRLPRYLQLLHGNFVALDERKRRRFLQQLARSARQVSDRELAAVLENEWRSRLTASWLIGLDKREQFRDRIGELLLDSEAAYAGQGYCLALARFATPPTPASWPPTWPPTSRKRISATTRTGPLAPCPHRRRAPHRPRRPVPDRRRPVATMAHNRGIARGAPRVDRTAVHSR